MHVALVQGQCYLCDTLCNLCMDLKLELVWIKDLQRLSMTGNFTRAAQDNNVSQSAFSRRIQALEQWAQTTLVDRSRHPVVLTPEGEQLLEVGVQALIHFDLVKEQISMQGKNLGPQVIFAAQHAIGWRFYPQWLNQFEQKFGPLRSRLMADNLPDCFVALLNFDADFVLGFESSEYRYIPASRNKLERHVIGHDRLIPVCLAGKNGKPVISFDDTNIAFLNYPANAPLGMHLEPVLLRTSLKRRLKLIYENSMTEALRMRVRNGEGFAWLPESLVKPDIESKLLTVVDNGDITVELDVCLYRNSSNNNKLAIKVWNSLSSTA